MDTTNTSPPPVATSDTPTPGARPWPGTREWTDDDYQQFVQLYSQGSFTEIQNDPAAWDQHFIPAGDGGDSQRPTLISQNDFHNNLRPAHHSGYGFLVLKLWETARAKGYTKTFEQQIQQAARHQAGAEKQQLRSEIQNLKENLPAPEPRPVLDPRQQWYEKIMAAAIPGAKLIEKVKLVQQAVLEGQPFRNSLLTDAAAQVIHDTFGPLMLPESADPLADPFEPETSAEPEPLLRKWAPEATTRQILNGAARELADLVSLLVARQRVSVGYTPDQESINQTVQLTRSIRHLTQAMTQTEAKAEPRKRGRPRKIPINYTEI